MVNQNYLALFEKVNSFIISQSYDERVRDDFMSEAIAEVMLHSGKRVRSVLCCMAHTCFSPLDEDALVLSWAIELFHNFTLVHDDIMDEAPLRRDRPTLYSRYGAHTALLIGDVMLIDVYEMLNQLRTPKKPQIFSAFNQTAKDICIGQRYDLKQGNGTSGWTLEDYMRMIRLKTAVLLGRSLYLGALLGGAKLDVCEQFYDVGVDMGLLFQIQDDYLDLYGQSHRVGKQRGGDILQGKKNILYFSALEHLSEEQGRTLTDLMENYKGEDKVERVEALYRHVNMEAHILARQAELFNATEQGIVRLPISETKRSDLIETAAYLISRMS